jgi:6-phosphofructokinase 1
MTSGMAAWPTDEELVVRSLGPCKVVSPVGRHQMVDDERRVLAGSEQAHIAPFLEAGRQPPAFELAGARERLFFDPAELTCGIVTCGGLCPGLNNVIRSLYHELRENYGIREVLGVRNGFRGLVPAHGLEPLMLTDAEVEDIHKLGGTMLGTSRGPQDEAAIVDFLVDRGIDLLFCVGGDGTQRGAHDVYEEVARRDLPIAVVGIPKTIDNDIPFVDRTFGYLTALEEAQRVLRGAHIEARAAINGIALVKLMGRHAGFIAAGAALASQDVDFVLVPEVEFPLRGDDGFLAALVTRVKQSGNAVVVVSEGAGQHLMARNDAERDASGNVRHADIGMFLKRAITDHFKAAGVPVNLKYIDPSYIIRSVPANCADRLLCDQLARHAAHAAMAGKTDTMIGFRHGAFIHVPIGTAIRENKSLQVEGDRWRNVLLATGQPRWGAK